MGENIYKTHLIRGKYPKICKGLKQVNIIKTNTQLHTVEREWTFLESGHAVAQLSRFFTPLIIRNTKQPLSKRWIKSNFWGCRRQFAYTVSEDI